MLRAEVAQDGRFRCFACVLGHSEMRACLSWPESVQRSAPLVHTPLYSTLADIRQRHPRTQTTIGSQFNTVIMPFIFGTPPDIVVAPPLSEVMVLHLYPADHISTPCTALTASRNRTGPVLVGKFHFCAFLVFARTKCTTGRRAFVCVTTPVSQGFLREQALIDLSWMFLETKNCLALTCRTLFITAGGLPDL